MLKNKIRKKRLIILLSILVISFLIFQECSPIREFTTWKEYEGNNDFVYTHKPLDKTKKNVLIIADNDGTEIFDLLAPFFLFNATEKANVYVVSPKKYPIILRKGVYILPQLTFREVDDLNIKPDVIIIPNLSAMNAAGQNLEIVNWIKSQFDSEIKILSICDGSLTAAATGIFDGKLLTTHATDYEDLKSQFSKPRWVKDISVTHEGNLYSTAGVSNATEGSLAVIQDLFGLETLQKVKAKISYPNKDLKINHNSIPLVLGDKLKIAKKIFLQGNKKIGIFLENDINEFKLAAILDTYNRTFPKSIESFTVNDVPIISKYGLTIFPTGKYGSKELDEVHLVHTTILSNNFLNTKIIRYNSNNQLYIFDKCLKRISEEYGDSYTDVVKLLLDYN